MLFPVCIRCYAYHLRCDSDLDCQNCVQAGSDCKRAKCKNYVDNSCKAENCTRAHEKDEAIYKGHLISVTHVSKALDKDRNGGFSKLQDWDEDFGQHKRTRRGKRRRGGGGGGADVGKDSGDDN